MTLPIDTRPGAIRPPNVNASNAPFTASRGARPPAVEEDGFRKHLARAAVRLAEGEASMEASMAQAMRGEGLDQAQLIALQSGVYRYSQEMELASRLVDRATQAVKQTLQSQS
jgi:hypothetical protein